MRCAALLLLPLFGCYSGYGPVHFEAPAPRAPQIVDDDRPDGPFVSVQSETEPLWLHFRDWITDANAQMLLAESERAFRLNREWGLDDPLPDRAGPDEGLDIYFIEELDDSLGVAIAEQSVGDRCSSFSIVRLHEGPIHWRRWTLHHEIRHNFQDAQLCNGGPPFEADATFAADAAFPDMASGMWTYVPEFQARPDGPPLGDTVSWGFPYGAALFHRFLAERYGDGTPAFASRYLRRATVEAGRVAGAVALVLDDLGVDLSDAYEEFAVWRLLTPTFTWATPWSRAGSWRDDSEVGTESLEDGGVFEPRLATGGSFYGEFDPAVGVAVDVESDDGDRLVLQVVIEDVDEGWSVQAVEGLSVAVEPTANTDRAFVILTNTGPGTMAEWVSATLTAG